MEAPSLPRLRLRKRHAPAHVEPVGLVPGHIALVARAPVPRQLRQRNHPARRRDRVVEPRAGQRAGCGRWWEVWRVACWARALRAALCGRVELYGERVEHA